MIPASESPYLRVPPGAWLVSNDLAFAIADAFPVTAGHTLVVPRRPIATWWEATTEERIALWDLVDSVKDALDTELRPDGYNVGFNAGSAAGQTVEHLHIHVIPRFTKDVHDPTGGIRHVVPSPASPLSAESDLVPLVDGQERTLRLELLRCLRADVYDRVDLVVSFIMKSGLAIIAGALEDAIDRGAKVRILTTDYLQITDADALTRLLDLTDSFGDRLSVRLFSDRATSFHPKAYLFWSSAGAAARAFVGSSNLSASGIDGGVEWSVGVNDVTPLVAGFDRLWNDHRSVPLTHELLQDYRRRWLATRRTPSDLLQTTIELPSSDREPDATPPGHAVEAEHEAPAEAPTPRAVQRDALDALEQTRLAGHGAGLVVMATGLGKTWLAAFDTSRPQFRRILFIAHREEILRQSRGVFRAVQPDADLGLFNGTEKNQHARIVFASVQTLAGHISAFEPDEFDYVVVDEFHHAAARTYRKVIAHFRPQFLLGLTATPDRLDGADLLALSGDNLVFTCNLIAGIERGDLCTFRYFGIADDVDYTEIPWRSGRFDPDELTNAVATRQRAQHVLDEWRSKGGGPTLGFCVSVRHADFMAAYFRDAGVAAVAVHAQSTSAPRSAAIAELRAGTIEVVFSVDVFNEGLDVPSVSTVLMLRPTESPVVFLQQLGRGLRRSDDKDGLVVIDFIGNHRSFLLGPRTLLAAATDTSPSTKDVVEAMRSGDFRLPEGCFVNFDVELVDIFSRVVRIGAHDALEAFCRTHADETGRRPTAIQAWRAGHNPAAAKRLHGGWFGLLEHLDLLDNDEREAWQQHRDTLVAFETDAVNKSYKLITLRAMLDDGTLRSGTSITQVSWTAHRIVKSDPRLVADTQSSTAMPDPIAVSEPEWRTFWRKWPLAAWSGELRGQPGRCFSIEGDRFVPRFAVSDTLGTTFDELASELVDWRLARYLFNRQPSPSGVIRVRVAQSNGRPILFLDRTRFPSTPSGWTPFTADGEEYEGNFVKIALNVARRPGSSANELPRVLREWFGPSAGQPGTEHVVELVSGDGGWTLRPVGPAVSGDAVVDTAG